jgi:hypothetical protein
MLFGSFISPFVSPFVIRYISLQNSIAFISQITSHLPGKMIGIVNWRMRCKEDPLRQMSTSQRSGSLHMRWPVEDAERPISALFSFLYSLCFMQPIVESNRFCFVLVLEIEFRVLRMLSTHLILLIYTLNPK